MNLLDKTLLQNYYCRHTAYFARKVYGDKQNLILGCGGGQVVSVLAFYSDNPSSNPAEAYSVSCKICV